jgi:hypothetical protein
MSNLLLTGGNGHSGRWRTCANEKPQPDEAEVKSRIMRRCPPIQAECLVGVNRREPPVSLFNPCFTNFSGYDRRTEKQPKAEDKENEFAEHTEDQSH